MCTGKGVLHVIGNAQQPHRCLPTLALSFQETRLAFRTDTSTHLVSVLHLVLNTTQLACTCTHWPSFNTPVLCLGGAQVLQEGLAAASLRYEQLAPSPQLLPHFVADVLHLTCTAYMFTLQRSLPTTTDLLASSKVGEGSATINKNRHRSQSTPTLQASAVAKPLTFAIQCAVTHTHTPVVTTLLNAGPQPLCVKEPVWRAPRHHGRSR